MRSEIDLAMSKTKIALMSRADSAFFTTIVFSLKHVWDETVSTAYTDGTVIGFSPKFFMELSLEERVGVMVHEAMHVAFLHMDRLGTRDHNKWNIAADHVINLMLLDRGFKLPSFVLANRDFIGMGTEEVYNLLPDSEDPVPGGSDIRESQKSSGQLQQDVQDILVRAAVQSKMANDAVGTIPGDIQLYLDKLLNPKMPWNRILQKYITSRAKADYTFRKPNRRHFPTYILPSMYSETLMDLVVAVDISGSVSDAEFLQIISEVHSILKMQKPDKITLIQFDTTIKSVTEIHNVRELSQVVFTGRGGTYIGPVLEWINQNKPQLSLIFTDGCFLFYGAETKRDVVWLINDNPNFTGPFGKTIHYENKEKV